MTIVLGRQFIGQAQEPFLHDLTKEQAPPIGVLIAVQTQNLSNEDLDESLNELGRLAKTFGIEVVSRVTQTLSTTDKPMYFGPGKVETLATQLEELREEHPDRPVALIADDELTPWQNRRLLEGTKADDLLDRTELILEIFHRHAQSREARAQVELVRLVYQAPRLREKRKGADVGRVRGGKGAGESALEMGRRQIRDRIAELRGILASIAKEREIQRARRSAVRCVALVGYTNAGKSTLMRSLTGSQVLVEDKLFATLESTVRQLQPEVRPGVLVSDTVGFIRKLPHDLVASFKSTLDAALEASMLLHVVDASDPACRSHIETTLHVLGEIGGGEIPMCYVFNKMDQIKDPEHLAGLREDWPDALFISAHQAEGVAKVHELIVATFQGQHEEQTLTLRHDQGSIRAKVFELCEVLEEKYDADAGTYLIRATPEVLAQIDALITPKVSDEAEEEDW